MFNFSDYIKNKKLVIIGVIVALFLLGGIVSVAVYKIVPNKWPGIIFKRSVDKQVVNSKSQISQRKKTDLRVILPKWVKQMGIEAPQELQVFDFREDKENGVKTFSGYWKGNKDQVFRQIDRIARKAKLQKVNSKKGEMVVYTNFDIKDIIGSKSIDESKYGIIISAIPSPKKSEFILSMRIDSFGNMRRKFKSRPEAVDSK